MIGSARPTQRPATTDRRCSGCGYGIATQRPLPLCPMCGGAVWLPSRTRADRDWRDGIRSATVRLGADRPTL